MASLKKRNHFFINFYCSNIPDALKQHNLYYAVLILFENLFKKLHSFAVTKIIKLLNTIYLFTDIYFYYIMRLLT